MHGVKKTEITEQERAKVEREKKKHGLAYETSRDILRRKLERDEFDDELLELSEKVLKKNADIYSLWNMRRLAIIKKESLTSDNLCDDENENQQSEDEKPNLNAKKKIYDAELKLTLDCITTHPKSYGAWHHRAWCIERHPTPDYEHELKLCTKCLQLDERNFHCWDYRRTICKIANVKPEDELAFSNEALKHNLCNYSAWHYRTTLLPMLYKPTTSDLPMESDHWRDELNRATEACVIDAEDSSAWIYSTWLFAHDDTDRKTTPIFITIDGERAFISFNKAIRKEQASILANAEPVSCDRARSDYVWRVASNDINSHSALIDLTVNGEKYTLHRLAQMPNVFAYKNAVLMQPPTLSDVKRDALNQFLVTCDKLIDEEKELIWPHILAAQCASTLDRQRYDSRISEEYKTLMQIDAQRKHLYELQLSEHELTRILRGNLPTFIDGTDHDLTLRLKKSTDLPWRLVSYLLPVVDVSLSENWSATRLLPKLLRFCPNLLRLDLQGTGIKTVEILSDNLPANIEFLSVASCDINAADQLTKVSASTSLRRLICAENPICSNEGELKKLSEMQPVGRKLIPFWL